MAHNIFQFLHDMLEVGKSPSTLKGMVAAIKAACVGPQQLAEGCCNFIAQFLKETSGDIWAEVAL